ncbi:hypothetical protein J6TS7_21050 [Paenibacillus dendritiformis]|uniref:macro domain-containing protein n=1 Tax=Paenibacillus TaxID=44249 RepID=UPI001B2A00F4|nr:macro domain-containing protein [Paenibacillus dendritiformis]GIO78495.1 hypothetical protein J6TS7_21050 [Paenibacillus dendritiformis]
MVNITKSFVFIKDICSSTSDVIVNAANAQGYMGGVIGRYIKLSGVAEALHYKSKGKLEELAKMEVKKRSYVPGEVYVTHSVEPLKAKYIFHAVTMFKPGQRSNLSDIEKCVQEIIKISKEYQTESITIPFLGCGTGRLNRQDVMSLYNQYFIHSDLKVEIAFPGNIDQS